MNKKTKNTATPSKMPLSVAAISSSLDTQNLGSTLAVLRNVDSTNAYIKTRISALDDGFVVLSETQTNGRGRMGKSFLSMQGGLYMSVLLMGKQFADNAESITVRAAVAVRNAIAEVSGLSDVGIKWVNDIYYNDKKICGILAERVVRRGFCDFCVLGIGVNVSTTKKQFGSELSDIAASISDFTTVNFSRNQFAAAILNNLEKKLFVTDKEENQKILEEYRSHSVIIGKDIYIIHNDDVIPAYVLGIDDDASLYVRYQDETTAILRNGFVSTKLIKKEKKNDSN